ncbi:MAG: aminotransferase class III-fold pyridoxal phosphate-dependent enzyme [Myxococcales bacterium]|nr:aminotransferase class III-fold pyridoxal phosphate-dependent enzyme [Myxococcales bacterium]
MESKTMIELCKEHTLYTWSSSEGVNPIPVARAEGIYFYTPDGDRFIDFNSQLMCVNAGHNHPKIIEGMKKQLDELVFVYPGTATEPRARLGKKLAELAPGDMDKFFFTLGGAEANENAIKIARQATGRQKIISRYRSYHGATNLCMQLTGDPRRIPNEPGTPGIIRVMDPWPYDYSFGDNEEEITANHLRYLEETIMYEGPETIAAMIIETVTGTNGILPPPKGWLVGLSELLDKYGILLICDEVMAGFGRTGKWFACEHGPIVPDILTFAKGLTSAHAPLGAVGMRPKVHKYFDNHVFWGGLTYNSHCLGLAAALANIEVYEEEGLVENAANLESVMLEEMARLKERHKTVKAYRAIGLFGMIDLQADSKGTPMAPYNGSSEAMNALGKRFKELGLFTFVRWGSFMANPPLCITEAQLREAFAIVDKALEVTHPYFKV